MFFVLEEGVHVPSLCSMTIYNREKSSTSAFSIKICPACLVLVLGVRHLKRGKGFFFDGIMNGACAVAYH